MKAQLSSLAISAMQIMAPILLALLGLLAKKVHDLITAKVKNEKLGGILHRLDDAAFTVVREVEQTVVSKLDPTKTLGDNGKAARAAALDSLKAHLGPKGLDDLKQILGVNDQDLEKALISRIESQVHTMKTGGLQ